MKNIIQLTLLLLFLTRCTGSTDKTSIWLDELKIPEFSESISATTVLQAPSGDSVKIGQTFFKRGLGARTISVIPFFANGNALHFSAVAGIESGTNSDFAVRFYVLGDRKILFESPELKAGNDGIPVNVDLTGIKRIGLLVINTTESAIRPLAWWGNARIDMVRDSVLRPVPNTDEKYILTPLPSKEPRINSAKIFGATPENPFLYTIAASGQEPINFSAENLPAGLSLDSKTGIISGKMTKRGTWQVRIKAKNEFGEASNSLKIVIGDTIALTPPIGWNGWNSWARNIDREKVMSSARAMVSKGLSRHGWTYINIDDAWQGQRGGKYKAILPNEKFPDFKEMIDSIHALGLKTGIYSTPWISSYAGYPGGSSDFESGIFPDSVRDNKRAYRHLGKYRFETEDARQMADWGIDYLKYDWRIDLNSAERMSAALKKSGRDILYSLSNSAPFDLASDWARISNTWRTGPDIRDSWTSLYLSAFTVDKWAPFAGRGHWNDPDMLIVGKVTTGADLHPTRLTPDEQYSHVSLFSLLAAPLLIGCPIEQLDDFTLNLLTNDEVIEIDQDPLGKPARLIANENGVEIWVKPMADGSLAVGLFNTGNFGKSPESYFRWGDEKPVSFEFDFDKIGQKGNWKLHDVWRQKDLGEFSGKYTTEIRHHGVVLLRMNKI